MSRYAQRERESLRHAYHIAMRLLLLVSLPIAAGITSWRPRWCGWLAAQYLNVPLELTFMGRSVIIDGGSDLALRILIWSIPIGFVNSVTQYVLIAVNQQHFLTRAFLMGVSFNIVGNLIAIPRFGYVGAAVVTIFSEFSLLFPFYYSVGKHVGVAPWARILGPTLGATAVMLGVTLLLVRMGVNVEAVRPGATLAYVLALAPLEALAPGRTWPSCWTRYRWVR